MQSCKRDIMWREYIQTLEPGATFFPGATPSELSSLEATFGLVLPEELRSLLTESNGVRGTSGLRLIWAVEEMTKRNMEMRTAPSFRDNFPFDHLLFFADAGNGDQFALGIIQGAIKRPAISVWNHEDDSRTWVAPTLKRYLEWWVSGKLTI